MVSSILPQNELWDNFQYIKSSQCSFFGRIEDTINCFQCLLTFIWTQKNCSLSLFNYNVKNVIEKFRGQWILVWLSRIIGIFLTLNVSFIPYFRLLVFGHFSCVIFFPFFPSCPSCFAKCKKRLCNYYFCNFITKNGTNETKFHSPKGIRSNTFSRIRKS